MFYLGAIQNLSLYSSLLLNLSPSLWDFKAICKVRVKSLGEDEKALDWL